MWSGERVDAIVVVQRLRHLARPDLDTGGCAELERAEHPVEHAEHDRMGGRTVEAPCLGEKGVDATRVEALERVTTLGDVREEPGELGAGRRRFRS